MIKGIDVRGQKQRPAAGCLAGARDLRAVHRAPQRAAGDAELPRRLSRREIDCA